MATVPNYLKVEIVDFDPPVLAVCREFHGAYERTPDQVAEVEAYVTGRGIASGGLDVLGIYFDEPGSKPAEELRSYQGVLVDARVPVEEPFFIYELWGQHVRVRVRADQPEQFGAAYGALFGYASSNGLNIASEVGIQITRALGELVLCEVHLELGERPSNR
jgi:DNA gyrase inhibitor GyrI